MRQYVKHMFSPLSFHGIICRDKYKSYRTLEKELKQNWHTPYLHSHTYQQSLKVLEQNWKSYFQSLKDYKKNPDKYKAMPQPPKYKHVVNHKNEVIFTNFAIRRKDGHILLSVPFNDIEAYKEAMKKWGKEIAAVLVEPIVGNFGIVMPKPGFLEQVNEITHQYGALVIYDEVITAFRFTYGGAQNLLNVTPDMTALGKIIGGGLPIGAYGGKKEMMEQVAPLGPSYQAGTMAGNPASIRAGIATLEVLSDKSLYQQLNHYGKQLEEGILQAAKKHHQEITLNRLIGAFTIYFGSHPIENYEDAKQTDSSKFARFFKLLLKENILIAPSKYEAWFLTIAHTQEDIDQTLAAIDRVFAQL